MNRPGLRVVPCKTMRIGDVFDDLIENLSVIQFRALTSHITLDVPPQRLLRLDGAIGVPDKNFRIVRHKQDIGLAKRLKNPCSAPDVGKAPIYPVTIGRIVSIVLIVVGLTRNAGARQTDQWLSISRICVIYRYL